MNVMISPSESAISFRTAFSRSSNSPRYFEPAIIEPRSSATTSLFLSDSGTSPSTMRCARPSTIAVLPTPGSPIRTGLFFVRRDRTWIVRRISSSRPMTGSSLPRRACSVRSRPYRSSAWYFSSGFWSVTRWRPRTSASADSTPSRVSPASFKILDAPESTSSSASSRCSVETYSSVSVSASAPAWSSTAPAAGEIRTSAACPCAYTLGIRSSA